jgi:hypothetical protein
MPTETWIAIAFFVACFGGFAAILAWGRWYTTRTQ